MVEQIVAGINSLKRLADLPVDRLVKYAEDMGRHLVQINLKTNQIRKFLDAVKKLEAVKTAGAGGSGREFFDRDGVKLLKPKLAYAAGRQSEVKPLMRLLDPCIDRVETKEDFKQFARLVESIVAYHRFYGGRD
ncbi:type III-A CRISPR-associated protein Csm2 [Desulfotomaculum copahuensis]|uniref:CRISPR system Cms protein Csm2 n=1 Tax=Desulfotomaculum copahuensis TaxID=1838280 RepID=A0A1B7LCP3_9FIRM|nr:type III-A CRISPR-associated protein Csm2 [Desulfotomaculum copahuensis]